MRPDLLASLRAIMRGDLAPKTAVTPETPVTGLIGYRSNPLELQALQRLQVKNRSLGKVKISAVTSPVPPPPEPEQGAIDERAGLCADGVPPLYLDAWARLNCRKPLRASEAEWRRALDDGGRFLDAWGSLAAEWGWTVGELFDLPRGAASDGGLVWFITGAKVEAFGPDHASLEDGRIFDRGTVGGEHGA